MTLDEIKELIEVVQQSGVAELEVQRGDNRVRIRKSVPPLPAQEIVIAPAATPIVASPTQPAIAPPALPSANTAPQSASVQPEEESELTYVKSPIVGTFYESPGPDAPPFVKVGDAISPGAVLCIIESMKLMNEIESEVSGVLVRKLVENGKPVEYGQALFAVRPA